MKIIIIKYTLARAFLPLFFLIVMSGSMFAQPSNTMYYMYGVPQSHLLNPAFQPRCGLYLGLPGISPLAINADNSALTIKDVMWWDKATQQTITFLDSSQSQNMGKFLNNFKPTNFFTSEFSSYLTSFGFRRNDWYYSVAIAAHASANFTYAGDLMHLLLEGNQDGDVFNLSGMGLSLNSYVELSLGISRKVSDELSLGIRPKVLFGLADVSMKNREMSLETHIKNWDMKGDFDMRANVPFLTIPTLDGKFNFDSAKFQEDIPTSEYVSNAMSNLGLGVDLGVDYMPLDRLHLSASIIDLGFIKWKGNPFQMKFADTYNFTGVDILQNDSVDIGQAFLDTLNQQFNYVPGYDAYTTFLTSKIYLGFRYEVSPNLSLGVLSRSHIIRNRIREQLTLSANFYPSKVFAASFSYSIMNNSYNSFGFGGSAKLGPLNLYIISDLIPHQLAPEESTGLLIPHKATAFNMRFGLNLLFGCKVKKNKDIPMIE